MKNDPKKKNHKNKSYDKKIFRLISILNKLDCGKPVLSSELSKEFNVSIRSIQRDLELLSMSGFPLLPVDKGQYKFVEGFSLRKMKVTNEEASLLSLLHDISSSLGDKFEKSFQNILAKVLKDGLESPYYVKMSKGIKVNRKIPFSKDLEDAVKKNQQVRISYLKRDKGKEKEYIVCPLKIVYYDGFWYLLCQADNKKDVFTFRLDHIKDVESLDNYFTVSSNLSSLLEQSSNIWFTGKRDKTIVVKVDSKVSHFFKNKEYFPLQKIRRENGDDSLVVESKVGQYEEVVHTIMSWIPHIVVIEPKELKDRIKVLIETYQKKI